MVIIRNTDKGFIIFSNCQPYYIIKAFIGGNMKKHKRKELGLSTIMLLGTAFSIVVIILTALIMAIISSLTKDPTSLTGAFSLVTLLISGAISGFVTSRANGEGGKLVGIVSSISAAFIIVIVGLVWKRGMLNLGALINVIAFIAVSVVFSMLGTKKVKRGHRRYV